MAADPGGSLRANSGRTSTAPASSRVRLTAEHVRLAYDERVVVDDLDLQLTEGSFTAIVGPNACGKSTLLGAIKGLVARFTGRTEPPADPRLTALRILRDRVGASPLRSPSGFRPARRATARSARPNSSRRHL